jgi:hypothetical protein
MTFLVRRIVVPLPTAASHLTGDAPKSLTTEMRLA